MCCCIRSEACIALDIAIIGTVVTACGRVSGNLRASCTAVAARPSAARIEVGRVGMPQACPTTERSARATRPLRRIAAMPDIADAPPARKRVLLAAPRGYCAGVDRAVQTVEHALDLHGAPVYVRKEIVHNKHVVESLRERGAIFVEEIDDSIPEGAVTVFSAHGVSPAVHEEAA